MADDEGAAGPRGRFMDLVRGRGVGVEERTGRLVGNAAFVWLVVGCALLAWLAWRVLWPVLAVVGPVLLLAGLVVYALDPAVSALARRGLPRWAGTAVVYLLIAGGLIGVSLGFGPLLGDQVAQLAEEAPELRERGRDLLDRGLGSAGLDVELGPQLNGGDLAREVAEETEEMMEDEAARQRLLGLLGGLAGMVAGTARFLVLLVVGPVVAFYLLADLPRVRAAGRQLLPPDRRDELVGVAAGMGRVVGGYVRGQLVVALFVGTAATVGFALIGLPFWALVGAIAGVSNLVPFVGPFVGGVLGVGVALLAEGVGLAFWVVVVVVVVQQLESQVVSPLVMGRSVHIPAVVVLLAVVVGGALYGVLGLLLAVPGVAAAKVLAVHLWHRHIPWAAGDEPGESVGSHAAALEAARGEERTGDAGR